MSIRGFLARVVAGGLIPLPVRNGAMDDTTDEHPEPVTAERAKTRKVDDGPGKMPRVYGAMLDAEKRAALGAGPGSVPDEKPERRPKASLPKASNPWLLTTARPGMPDPLPVVPWRKPERVAEMRLAFALAAGTAMSLTYVLDGGDDVRLALRRAGLPGMMAEVYRMADKTFCVSLTIPNSARLQDDDREIAKAIRRALGARSGRLLYERAGGIVVAFYGVTPLRGWDRVARRITHKVTHEEAEASVVEMQALEDGFDAEPGPVDRGRVRIAGAAA